MSMEISVPFDRELRDWPEDERMREWMMRVEALIFASSRPVPSKILSAVIGSTVPVETVIAALLEELRPRPYELVHVAGGWQLVTRQRYSALLRTCLGKEGGEHDLSRREIELLAVIALRQPLTRRECEAVLGRAVNGDDIGRLRGIGFIAAGHRRPGPGAPYTFVTTDLFLEHFQMNSLADLYELQAQKQDLG
ncbi:hypothetical protein IP70_13110 [alpha proteobacterium AAP38]|nr:hypothetical protein IP70_13110 [alpha proteobacterium AAP38]